MVPATSTGRPRTNAAILGDPMQLLINLLSAHAYTPDGGIADPNHPIYALIWALKLIA